MTRLELGVFLPVGNNGYLISATAPQYAPTYELSEADKIKAELFDRSARATHDQIANDWRDMLQAAPRQDAQAFLRHHHTAFVGVAELKTLHNTVTQLEIVPAAHVSDVARTWSLRAQMLKSLMAAAPGSGIGPGYPGRAKFERLTLHEERVGLLDDAHAIGTNDGW